MTQPIVFSNRQRVNIISRYLGGEPYAHIARDYKVSPPTISKNLIKWGIDLRNKIIEIPEKHKQQIINLYDDGYSVHTIGEMVGYNHDLIWKRLQQWGIKLRKPAHVNKYRVNDTVFSRPYDEFSAYFAGLLMADGCVHTNRQKNLVTLSSKDMDILEKFRDFMGDSSRPIHDNGDNSTHTVVVSSKQAIVDLAKIGVIERKSLIAEIKDSALLNNRHFFRGLIDGDGHIRAPSVKYPQPFIFLGMGSKAIVKQWVSYVYKLTGKRMKIRKDATRDFYTCQISGKVAKTLIKELYSDALVYIDRKYKVALEIVNDRKR